MKKILILGFSNIAKRRVIPAIKKINNLKFEIASKRINKENFGQVFTYKSYIEAINNSNAEIVYVSLPNSLHYKFANLALMKNKHVIVDKPITHKHKDLIKLINLAKKKKLLLAEAILFNYHNQFYKMKKFLYNKRIQSIIMNFNIPKPQKNNIKSSVKLGGGCINDMSSYCAAVLRLFFKNYRINSIIRNDQKRLNEKFSIHCNDIKNKSEFYGNFSHNSEYSNDIKIVGKNFWIRLYRFCAPPDNMNMLIDTSKNNKLKKMYAGKDDTFNNFIRIFLSKIKSKKYNFYFKSIIKDSAVRQKINNFR
jgi:predicted dehydrogenase